MFTELQVIVFVYDLLICENFIIYQGERFVIKETAPKVEGHKVFMEVKAYHIMYEFQNHFVESNKVDDEGVEDEDKTPKYTLEEYLEYGFKNQKIPIKYTFEIYGDFTEKIGFSELGGKNGIEYIKDAAEDFGCIIFANDTEIGFYNEDVFYQRSEEIIRFDYNTDTVNATVNTLELRTAIHAHGKKDDKGKYIVEGTFTSEAAKVYGLRFAEEFSDERITKYETLKKNAMAKLQDAPKTELEVNYISYNSLGPRDKVFFVHELMGYNTELKVVKLERGHPFTNTIDSVSFSNEIKDMIQIQQILNKHLRAQDNKYNYQSQQINQLYTKSNEEVFGVGESIGSVLE